MSPTARDEALHGLLGHLVADGGGSIPGGLNPLGSCFVDAAVVPSLDGQLLSAAPAQLITDGPEKPDKV